MFYVIDIDYEKCTGCQSCTITCAVKQAKIANPLFSRIQVARFEAEGVHIPLVCQQCEDAPCRRVCPVDALPRDPVTQVISVNYDRCIGCRFCVLACPFGAMLVNHQTRKVFKCDHCQGDPICVKVCHPEAIQYVPLTRALYAKRATVAEKIRDLQQPAAIRRQ